MSNPFYELVADTAPQTLTPVSAELAAVPEGCLLDTLGMRLTDVGLGMSRVEMTIGPIHLNQRGIAQGGTLVALADAAAGWASYAAVEAGIFTTVDLSCNLVGRTEVGGTLVALATPVHLGRKTLVLNVDILSLEQESSPPPRRLVAHFTCTQLVLGG